MIKHIQIKLIVKISAGIEIKCSKIIVYKVQFPDSMFFLIVLYLVPFWLHLT